MAQDSSSIEVTYPPSANLALYPVREMREMRESNMGDALFGCAVESVRVEGVEGKVIDRRKLFTSVPATDTKPYQTLSNLNAKASSLTSGSSRI
jgi:hypothetical protein